MQILQDINANRYIQVWAPQGAAGWKVDGKCKTALRVWPKLMQPLEGQRSVSTWTDSCCSAQILQDIKANRFIQVWAAEGAAGWKLEGECEPDISFGLGKIDILGDNWFNVVTFADGEQFTWNKVAPLTPGSCLYQHDLDNMRLQHCRNCYIS